MIITSRFEKIKKLLNSKLDSVELMESINEILDPGVVVVLVCENENIVIADILDKNAEGFASLFTKKSFIEDKATDIILYTKEAEKEEHSKFLEVISVLKTTTSLPIIVKTII